MQLIYLPLENLEQRYTVMMNESLAPHCDIVCYPEHDSDAVPSTQFLNVVDTCKFKAKQLAMVADLFADGLVQDGATFLVGDIWYSGIASIRCMAELSGLDVKLIGFNYAGRSDPTDVVQGLGSWADDYERATHQLYDRVIVGSKFHKDQVERFLNDNNGGRVKSCGYPWNPDWCIRKLAYQDNAIPLPDRFVVWPHRPCREKGVGDFAAIVDACPDQTFVVTSCTTLDQTHVPQRANVLVQENLTKGEYYYVLQQATHYLSTAYQETFGYTLQEALLFGCKVHVPRRVCYPEFVDASSLFESLDEFPRRFDSEGELSSFQPSNIETILLACRD